MVISCPACKSRYRINPAAGKSGVAKVKCPGCEHVFEVTLDDESAGSQSSPSSRPAILIVDDARFFREMIKDILNELAVELLDAADGNEAWTVIEARQPQLVLLDLNIPGKSGKEILKDLRMSPLRDKVKVLAMSGVERGDGTASEVKYIGANDFISKSFKPRELQDRVRSILALKS